MRVLENADTRDLPALLVRLPRLARHILLEAHAVPHFDRTIFRGGDEEELIGRDVDCVDGGSVLGKVRDESAFGSRRRPLSRRKACAQGLAPRHPDGDMRAELRKRFSVLIQVGTFEQLLDARIVAICKHARREHEQASQDRELDLSSP